MTKKYEDRKNTIDFFEQINKSGVNYILIKNICDELPSHLIVGKDIDIIVDYSDYRKYHAFMKTIGRLIEHPYSIQNGWNKLYELPEFEMWRLFNGEELYVDVTFKLCCKSIMPMLWLPLDRCIQEYLWRHKNFNHEKGYWQLDKNTQFVYYIVRCVFDKRVFSDKYIYMLESIKNIIDYDVVRAFLELVFFKFTPTLMLLLEKSEYEIIIPKYLSYSDY